MDVSALQKNRLRHLEQQYNRITTSLGGIVKNTFIYCGEDVTNTLGGTFSQTAAFLLWVLGRKPTEEETRLVDTIICLNIYPDPRIWSIRSGAYAAVQDAPLSACIAAGHIAANGKIFGIGAVLQCSSFFKDLLARLKKNSMETVVKAFLMQNKFFPGFGRPLIQGNDERYIRLQALLKEWNYRIGIHTKTLYKLAPILEDARGLYPNFASLLTTLMLDDPFQCSDNQLTILSHIMVNLPSAVVAVERHDNKNIPFLPLKVIDIEYTGKPRRTLENHS
ncbi:MAG: hypothetical protein JW904_14895 [Spirochaetales bacterium]|nr:hypothetical protein [Spirochaetales bacterium]